MSRALLLAGVALLAGCPAPPLEDDEFLYDVQPFDATPLDPPLRVAGGAPSCSPEAIIDLNARGVREGREVRVRVDTSAARDDLRSYCVAYDSREVVLRYRTPMLTEADVKAVRVTTIGPGTGFDTVLGIRLTCEPGVRDITCSNDAFLPDGRETRASTVYHVGTTPEETLYILLDGYDGSAGVAEITLTEITELGVRGAPCHPVPPQRLSDPAARTAYFRCPHRGLRCSPGAGADGTDLCVPIVPLGAPCDTESRTNVCADADVGAECARNPSAPDQTACALPGTAPGARCRGTRGEPERCDMGLVCSEGPTVFDRDECVPVRSEGETCDPAPVGYINRCAAGLECCAVNSEPGATTYCARPSAGCIRPRTEETDR